MRTHPSLVCPGPADAQNLGTGTGTDTGDGSGGLRPLPPTNTARLTALTLAGRRPALRTAGLLHRPATTTGHDPAGAPPELDRLIDARCTDYRGTCATRRIPVARQAEQQARPVVAAFEPDPRHPRTLSRSGEQGWGAGGAVPMHLE
ncbi:MULTISPECIES: hypothetical protein [unclassified Streptomyces]|uniref:hypothetical protein n=1 Tax=unclassified Streptomyces TaxID=2593676 RepID=UPI00073CD900|nr:hypothetical protein APS67_003823 [Streptomyces sp. AVP053U2]